MDRYFPDKPPPHLLTPEERTRIARKFRRRAILTDVLFSAGLAVWLVSKFLGWNLVLLVLILILAVALLSCATFFRCPCCGRIARQRDHLSFFAWRGFQCPDCGFTPEQSK